MSSRPSEYSSQLHPELLDFNSLNEVPATHAWTSLQDHPSTDCGSGESVPVIDLKHPEALELVGRACKEWGVLQVRNHGIPTRLLNDIEALGMDFFSLPLQQKLKVARTPGSLSGYGLHRFSPFFPKRMWSEGFTIVGPPHDHARKLWPQNHTKFCDVIEECKREMKQLAWRLIGLMLGSLGITREDLKWADPRADFEEAGAFLQLNYYPACPDPDHAMGLAVHTDSTLLTILHQSDTSGLQVLREGTGWVTVPPLAGALVVNLGDLFHILSNGLYPSAVHRVVVNRTRQRLSVAFLYGPPAGVEISPLPKLVDQSHPPLYRPVTWNDYLAVKGKHFDKALSSIRLRTRLLEDDYGLEIAGEN